MIKSSLLMIFETFFIELIKYWNSLLYKLVRRMFANDFLKDILFNRKLEKSYKNSSSKDVFQFDKFTIVLKNVVVKYFM